MEITLVFLFIMVILTVWTLYLTVLVLKYRKKNNLFFESGDENIYQLLKSVVKDNEKFNKRSERVEKGLDEAVKIIKKSYQKQAIVRYNPFKETGGNQSFSLAVLDFDKNGYVITSIHGREADRVYCKPIVGGKSEHNLSAEEIEAIDKAITSNT
jgi:hypothetical protein